MLASPDGSGEFSQVTLRSRVAVSAKSDAGEAMRLHMKADATCYIACSVNFPARHNPEIAPS